MKKIISALGAACVALSGLAASPQVKIAPGLSSAEDVITSVEGEKVDVTVTTSGITLSGFGFTQFKDQMYGSHIVYGSDNDVYIYEIFPDLPTKSYVKGVKEGDKIVVELPQAIYYEFDPDLGFPEAYYMTILTMQEDWYWPEEKSTLILIVDADGIMTAEGLSQDVILGVADSDDGTWIGLGAWDLSIAPFDEVPVELPDGFEVSENFWTAEGDGFGWQVSFAQGADEIYFQGLCERMPDAWVRGTVEYDDYTATVSIAQDQYIGDYLGYHIFTKCVELKIDDEGNIFYEDLMDPDYVFQLVWDFEEETMVAKDKNVVLLFNTSKNDVYYVNDLMDMILIHQDSFEGVPENPYGLAFADEMQEQGYSSFSFFLPAVSTEGDYLKLDDLSYVVYVDGEAWEFDADEYNMEESLEEIPWSFNGNWILKRYGSTEHMVAFFVEGISTLGVQSVYKYDGVETRSEIMTISLEESAVEDINVDKEVAAVKYFDMSGREVSDPSCGLFIERITYADGSVASFKKIFR
ncbi:MAG: hypothetical protein K2L22_01070 [Muribaculaceae bacterium]|nr:hypothetical protein [Muribaculaceae bacterium]